MPDLSSKGEDDYGEERMGPDDVLAVGLVPEASAQVPQLGVPVWPFRGKKNNPLDHVAADVVPA
eukprot:97254-Pyramimonas_sp.AAC.1